MGRVFFFLLFIPIALDIYAERSGLHDRAWDLSFFLSFTAHKSVSMVFIFQFFLSSFLLLLSPFEFFRVHFVPSRVSFPRWLVGSV